MKSEVVASELARLAKELLASASIGSSYSVTRDLRTKSGNEFKAGEQVRIAEYTKEYPYIVRLTSSDGRKISLLVSNAHKSLSGFPKPPSLGVMERWSDEGAARSVDGQRVEPDGSSSSGAPSWLLVMGMI